MRRKTELPELLAPAGSMEALYAAVEAGADAVYLGGKAFGARAFAKNFEQEEIRRALSYCHLHGVRLYVTVNTLVYERELDSFLSFCRALYGMGVDALIVTDLGGIALLRKHLPMMELHASTQMGIHNSEGVSACASLGLSRAVIARECSLADMKSISEKSPLEIEVFLHGALCVCHSGQCLFSSLVGGRSGNRGECAQPCRLPYGEQGYPLSLKDMSLARHIPALIDAGVCSLKIEGRMKSADYVYGVTSIYRRLLDERRGATDAEVSALSALFSRGGFTDGYFVSRLGGMTGVRSEAQKEESRALGKREFLPMRVDVSAQAVFRLGEPSRLTLSFKGRCVTVQGETPAAAICAPLSREALSARLCKMGNTFLSLSPDALFIEMDENINLSPASVNALRRAAVEALEVSQRELPPEPVVPYRLPLPKKQPFCTALFYNPNVLSALSEEERSIADVIFVPLAKYAPSLGVEGIALPIVIMEREMKEVRAFIADAVAKGAKYALISNLSHIALCREAGLIPIGDFRMNLYNPQAAEMLSALGVEHSLCSLELTVPRAAAVGGVLVYGRAPLMITERCFVKENAGCSACGSFAFTDRRGMRFPVLREAAHRSLILNSLPTYMGDRKDELSRAKILHRHFIFSTERVDEIRSVLYAWREGAPLSSKVRRIGVGEARMYGGEHKTLSGCQAPSKPKNSKKRQPLPPRGNTQKQKATNGKKRR